MGNPLKQYAQTVDTTNRNWTEELSIADLMHYLLASMETVLRREFRKGTYSTARTPIPVIDSDCVIVYTCSLYGTDHSVM